MKLFLIAYANVAILVPALWIGARPLATTPLSDFGSWPRKCADHSVPYRDGGSKRMVASKRRHAPPHLETNGQLLTRSERKRLQKADEYVAERRRSLSRRPSFRD